MLFSSFKKEGSGGGAFTALKAKLNARHLTSAYQSTHQQLEMAENKMQD